MTDRNAEIARLIGLTADYLRQDLRPVLEGRHAFLTLIAANLLDSLARDVSIGGVAEHKAAERAGALTGSTDGDPSAELSRMIEQGLLDEGAPGLLEHLRETVLDRLAIDQPSYEAYRRERQG